MCVIFLGERTAPEGDFLVPDPNFRLHRALLKYDDDDIANFWEEASQYALDKAGVDFTSIPVLYTILLLCSVLRILYFEKSIRSSQCLILLWCTCASRLISSLKVNPETGMKCTPDKKFSLVPIEVNMGFRLTFTTITGDLSSCPMFFGGSFM